MRWRLCVEAVWTDWLTGWVSLFGDFEYFALALTHSLALPRCSVVQWGDTAGAIFPLLPMTCG